VSLGVSEMKKPRKIRGIDGLVVFQDRCNRPLCHPSELLNTLNDQHSDRKGKGITTAGGGPQVPLSRPDGSDRVNRSFPDGVMRMAQVPTSTRSILPGVHAGAGVALVLCLLSAIVCLSSPTSQHAPTADNDSQSPLVCRQGPPLPGEALHREQSARRAVDWRSFEAATLLLPGCSPLPTPTGRSAHLPDRPTTHLRLRLNLLFCTWLL
jgi:hypothetical protein